MAYQLVLSGNRILAHGEAGCFLSMGGTVICEEKGKAYPNATVVTHEGGLPADIDKVGYEYHAGVFIPCAPYGTGAGDILVACEDCGTPKRSGYNSALLKYLTDFMMSKGAAGGLATLDSTGKLTSSQLPPLILDEIETKSYSRVQYQSGAITSTFEFDDLKEFYFTISISASDSGSTKSPIYFYSGSDVIYSDVNSTLKNYMYHGIKIGDIWFIEFISLTSSTTISYTCKSGVGELDKIVFTDNGSTVARTTTLTLYGVRA